MRGAPSHIDLNVSDPIASTHFYRLVLGHLGFEEHPIDDSGRTWWSLTHDDLTRFGIEVRPPREPLVRDRHERYAPGLDHLALRADSRADVDRLAADLVDAGYDVTEPPREYDYSPGYYALALDDPDGMRIEVVHDPTLDTVPVGVKVSYLVMDDQPVIDRSGDVIEPGRLPTPQPELNRFFYATVGAEWKWHSRLGWDLSQWLEFVDQPGFATWVGSVDHVPVGYFELNTPPGSATTTIEHFGLLPSFVGIGLGAQLLRACLDEAWRETGVERVELNTCSLDHPRALPNYLAAGFRVERTEGIVDHVPRRMM